MNGTQASQLADMLRAEMPDIYTTTNIGSGRAHIVCETGKSTFVVRQRQGKIVASVVYGELGRYIHDSDNPPQPRKYDSAEELIAELDGFVANAEYYTQGLVTRQKQARGNYQHRAAICKSLVDANDRLEIVHDGYEVSGDDKTWFATAEVISADHVSIYVRCDSETAQRIVAALKGAMDG